MNIPKGHLSPSAVNAWERCEQQFKIFHAEGAKSPPDFALHAKIETHKVVLEHDLKQKINSGKNLGDSELSEIYRGAMESSVPLAKEDPNLEGTAEENIEAEVAYFDKIIPATREWRQRTKPLKVEERLEGDIGGIPVVGYLDLVADEFICDRVVDLKRQGASPPEGSAAKSRQLITYSILENLHDVALSAIVENKAPKMVLDEGVVTPGEVARVTMQYQATAFQIDNAMTKDIWLPVNHGDKAKAWVCTAKFCGAWRIGSRDWLTGRLIECPFGEKSQVVVSLSPGARNGNDKA